MATYGRYTVGRTDALPMQDLDGYDQFDHAFKTPEGSASRVYDGKFETLQDEWSELEPYIKNLSKTNPDVEFIEYISFEGQPADYVLWKGGDRVQEKTPEEAARVDSILESLDEQRNQAQKSIEIAPEYGRQIIDDSFQPDSPLPRCGLEDLAHSEEAKQSWHKANERFAACASMYKWLDEKGILKEEAFAYDVIPEKTVGDRHYNRQINFAVDSSNLIKYKDEMLSSGVENADVAVSAILAEKGHTVEPSHLSGATCLTWTMQTYRDSGGCVGRSWETPHEQSYHLTHNATGIGDVVERRIRASRALSEGSLSEDMYYDVVKSGIKDMYKLDREAFLTKVPESFVKSTKNPDYKIVSLPCGKNLSDSGRMNITVNSANVYPEGGKYTISLGDFESKVKASVIRDSKLSPDDPKLKNGGHNYQSIYLDAGEVASRWSKDRKEYADNYKKVYGAAVDLENIPNDNIKKTRNDYTYSVKLDNIGTIYVGDNQISRTAESSSVHYSYGLENVRVYNKDDNGKTTRDNMTARNVAKLWEDYQASSQQSKSEQVIKSVSSFEDTKTNDVQDTVQK